MKKIFLFSCFLSIALFFPGNAFPSNAQGKGKQLSDSPQGTVPGPAENAVPAGDPGRGEKLFRGEIEFKNGGAPCFACHNVGAIRFLGGGNLGPDLTRAYAEFGQGIEELIETAPFPVMQPIFKGHPITGQEAADIAAYLQKSQTGQPRDMEPLIFAIAIAGFIVFMAIILFTWRARLVSVRKPLLEQAQRDYGKQAKRERSG
ncbi:MAG: hypothetical protein M0Z59_04610 [Nitrospiraceae bacterium]|nr:hypothetical protein [Nitrospiraceae bacterium]